MKRTVRVVLAGREYTIRSEASEEEVSRVAAFVNAQIDDVASTGGAVDTLDRAVLALMNVSGKYLRLKKETDLEAEAIDRLRRLSERLTREVASAEAAPGAGKQSL